MKLTTEQKQELANLKLMIEISFKVSLLGSKINTIEGEELIKTGISTFVRSWKKYKNQ